MIVLACYQQPFLSLLSMDTYDIVYTWLQPSTYFHDLKCSYVHNRYRSFDFQTSCLTVCEDCRLTFVFLVVEDWKRRWLSKRVSGGRKGGGSRRLVSWFLVETGVFLAVAMGRRESHRTTVLTLRSKVRTPHGNPTTALTPTAQTAANCRR